MTAQPSPGCCETLLERLIEAVRKRRPLWDNSTPLHKNVRVLMYCWQQISEEFGIDVKFIKRKWKSIREYFFKQVKELEKKGVDVRTDDGVDMRYIDWPLYNRLKFLMANTQSNNNSNDYKMSAEEQAMLEKITESHKRKRSGMETIIYHVPSPTTEDVTQENSSESPPILLIENKLEQTEDQSKLSQTPPLKVIKPTSKTLQEKGIIQPGTTNKVTLSDPPPLRVFKLAPNIKETESLQTKLRSEHSQPPPYKKFKPTPKNDSKQSETTSATELDADLHFFKSLLPFMRALPLKDNLRVRNGIQDLIMGELDALRTKDNMLAMTSRAPSNVYTDPLPTLGDEDAGFDQEYHPNRPIIVKEEFEDDQTLLFEVESKKFTYEEDDNYCGD